MNKEFAFKLKDRIVIKTSGITGTIRGRCDYVANSDHYLVAYAGADGVHREDWVPEDLLEPVQGATPDIPVAEDPRQ